ncbi:hypothetical protein LTR84_004699 [Exophiala bonariae]|uniref:Histone deacetylase domain-containing protein n=1 Tax=Exophiala bonariae TaxID=1690606 RepID=A0AAV9NP97_9EURO|nr:hypothetical protein LTR84_004699 [Exophiala bonariae]
MDPDIPAPSIEFDHGGLSVINQSPVTMSTGPPTTATTANFNTTTPSKPTPRRPTESPRMQYNSSPLRSSSQYKPVSPKPPSRSPSVASSYRGERQATPTLTTKRSTSSLSTARGTTPSSLHPLYRRSSSNLNPSSPASNGKSAAMNIPEKPPVTANSVAKDYFGKELEAHANLQSPVIVIVHDACYGHRFSRPRSTKNALASIVERPERIHATLLGAATAYVRLGGRHQNGPYMPRPKHDVADVKDVPFQIRKTSRTIPLNHPSVTFVHGTKWMEELQIMCDSAEAKLALNGKELVRPIGYGKDESGAALPKLHEGDLYLCEESLNALQGCLGGVCDAVDTIFSANPTKRAFVCIRPPGHHCSSNFPSGFCWLNNVHVGISYAAMNHGLTHAAIIDFDLHHGDGSQNIAWDQNRKAQNLPKNAAAHRKTPIGYYSLHDINSYPCEWGDEEKVRNASLCIDNAHGQSIWNVHLESWSTHQEFWKLYETKYSTLLEKARIFLRTHTAKLRAAGSQEPRAAIFISAGFDASEWESAGMQRHSVNVPTEFYARITADLVKLSQEEDLGVDGRLISVLEGGYSDRALTSGVLSHICGLATDVAPTLQSSSEMFGTPKFQTINNWIPENEAMANSAKHTFNSEWWALDNLEDLESVVAGRQPAGPKSLQDKTGNYSSPTHASTAKMTENARDRHSLSALQARLSLESQYVPPPPDVDWAVASYELSRVIIPSERQTVSCTHEELNAEATKARRERRSNIGVTVQPSEGMQLRDRRTRIQASEFGGARASSRTENRRTTIAAVSELPDPSMPPPVGVNGRPRRRSSDASSILSSFQGMKLSDDTISTSATLPSNQTGNISRATSIVPEKSAKTVAVKKTRAPPVTKAPAKPKTSPRKPRAPISTSTTGTTTGKPGVLTSTNGIKKDLTSNGRIPSASSRDITSAEPKPDDMENLANSMKKISIKLKVPTPEEHAAKQQQALEEKQKKPRAKKPAVPKLLKSAKSNPSTPLDSFVAIQPKATENPPIEVLKVVGGTTIPSVPPTQTTPAPEPVAAKVDAPESLPAALPSMNPEHLKGQPPASLQNHHVHTANTLSTGQLESPPPTAVKVEFPDIAKTMQTDQMPPPAYVEHPPIHENPKILPSVPPSNILGQQPRSIQNIPQVSSTGTRTPTRTKENLPVFTSQSPIPFATASIPKAHAIAPETSIWDIPETPQQSDMKKDTSQSGS